jgi:hypothetical protein
LATYVVNSQLVNMKIGRDASPYLE